MFRSCFFLSFFIYFCILFETTEEKGPCSSSWTHIAQLDTCFLSPAQPALWSDADKYCRDLDAYLVTIKSADKASVVRDIFTRENPSFFNWIGLRWDDDKKNYTWSDGSDLDYSLSLSEEKSVFGDCVAWVLDEKIDGWQSISCDYSQFFMCETAAVGPKTEWHYDEEGTISSSNWPENYDNDEYSTHIIKNPKNNTRILLKFETVETEKNRDSITVSDEGRTFVRLSGNYYNYSVISAGNQAMVNFKSDEDGVGKGFLLRYRILYPLPVKVFSNSFGTITSNNYPNSPDSFLIQSYQITCDVGYHVAISVKELHLDKNDRVKLFNGNDDKSPKLKIYRQLSYSTSSEIVKSTQNSLFISYDAGEQFGSSNHWKLEYNCVADGNLGDEIVI